MNYRLFIDIARQEISACIKAINPDGSVKFVPPDLTNTDWQEYQAWLALGNEPEPAE